MSDSMQKKFDLIKRGEKKKTPSGTITFIGLRVLDLPLQHALLSGLGATLISKAGLTPSIPASTSLLQTGIPLIDSLGHPTSALLFAFATGSTVKQIYWLTRLSKESFPTSAAATVALFNTLVNSVNSLLFLTFATTSLRSVPALSIPISLPFLSSERIDVPLSTVVGTLMYVAGITLETVAEQQRKAFKDAPENEGKVCKVGVWRWARHINYFGYSLWRGGYTMVATGWIGGLLMGGFQLWDLSTRAVGVLDEYCSNRYKDQWMQFKREVPYKTVPWVY
ncbi:hypothetical protein F5Y06DRAFT_228482 [Hypoxylon sp. FL0890]|nr:hypothetical protein F5Y06DRAFT_228482 [Hypoxylon sp. FL0890]